MGNRCLHLLIFLFFSLRGHNARFSAANKMEWIKWNWCLVIFSDLSPRGRCPILPVRRKKSNDKNGNDFTKIFAMRPTITKGLYYPADGHLTSSKDAAFCSTITKGVYHPAGGHLTSLKDATFCLASEFRFKIESLKLRKLCFKKCTVSQLNAEKQSFKDSAVLALLCFFQTLILNFVPEFLCAHSISPVSCWFWARKLSCYASKRPFRTVRVWKILRSGKPLADVRSNLFAG